jgi:hypothetical protein
MRSFASTLTAMRLPDATLSGMAHRIEPMVEGEATYRH